MFIAVAIAAGVVLGLARGGRLANLAETSFRLWPLLLSGLLVQASAAFVEGAAVPLILVSYGFLLLFAAANFHHAGMGIVLVGIALILAVIAANGGMPVRADAIVAAGVVERPDQIAELDFDPKRHLETPDDRLTFLGDMIPVPLAKEVLSFGDVIMSVGVADVIVHLLRRRPRPRPDLGVPISPDPP